MQVKQRLFILFFLKRKRKGVDKDASIYIRITVDGLKEELSMSFLVDVDQWDDVKKVVLQPHPRWQYVNRKILEARVDIERHFDLMQLKHGLATAKLVKLSYCTPLSGQQQREEQAQNLAFSETLDKLIANYLRLCEKEKNMASSRRPVHPEKERLLGAEKKVLTKDVNQLAREANSIFDNKSHQKTFMLTVNEYLLNFLQLSLTGHRSANTLEKWIGRKKNTRNSWYSGTRCVIWRSLKYNTAL